MPCNLFNIDSKVSPKEAAQQRTYSRDGFIPLFNIGIHEFYFCGFYQCENSGESRTNYVTPIGLYVKIVSDSSEFTYR